MPIRLPRFLLHQVHRIDFCENDPEVTSSCFSLRHSEIQDLSKRAPGVERVYAPGEFAHATRRANGEACTLSRQTLDSLVAAAAKAGVAPVEVKEAYPRGSEVPFDSERKRMITVHDVVTPRAEDPSPFTDDESKGWEVIDVKGAPDVVLDLCTQYQDMNNVPRPLDDAARKRILAANDEMTRDALRVLGLAYRLERDMPNDLDV